MRILMIHTAYKEFGGEDTSFSNEVRMLRDNGHSVETVLFKNKDYLFPLYPFNPASYFKVRRVLEAFRPDVVHIHNLFFAGSLSVLHACRGYKNIHYPSKLPL